MEQKCGDCKHYVKHYIFLSNRFLEIKSGHCTFPMNKSRKSIDKACKYFEKNEEKNEIHIIEIKIKHQTL